MNKLLDELVSQDPEKVSTFKLYDSHSVHFPFACIHPARQVFEALSKGVAAANEIDLQSPVALKARKLLAGESTRGDKRVRFSVGSITCEQMAANWSRLLLLLGVQI